tara:strand:+ start:656 stop:790 length:135 start_codon:yes stop_codon:yes gene_type:complete
MDKYTILKDSVFSFIDAWEEFLLDKMSTEDVTEYIVDMLEKTKD